MFVSNAKNFLDLNYFVRKPTFMEIKCTPPFFFFRFLSHPECIYFKCFRLDKKLICEGNPSVVPTRFALVCVMELSQTVRTGFFLD